MIRVYGDELITNKEGWLDVWKNGEVIATFDVPVAVKEAAGYHMVFKAGDFEVVITMKAGR